MSLQRGIAHLLTFLLFPTGLSLSKNVDQFPSAEVRRSNESVQFKCQHKITGYYMTLWYQQKENTGLNLIGYISYRNPDIEELYKERFSISGDGSGETFLDITRLRAEDTAVYFCAAIGKVSWENKRKSNKIT
uniref:Immunoglobulin V-set domain-containing protein n=1 Tax=Scleropages formosus TaxID=113540 RepID=A0A8C9VBR7_SCLFO